MAMILSVLLFVCVASALGSEFCPKQCDCDSFEGLNRATCVGQNIYNIDVGVSKAVQVYSLSHNMIKELDNYCFENIEYRSIRILNLSFNFISWIGLHAFNGLFELKNVDLSNNRLRDIHFDLFWETPQLEILDLSSNIFETLSEKNEPFLMHSKLQVLNLNNCRIKSLPNRMFTRLPNLKKLDLSENYMVALSTEVLHPLHKLERIELRNDYLHCNSEFISVENWIASRGIVYKKQCTIRAPKMSEKIISQVPFDKEPVDLETVWNITVARNATVAPAQPSRPLTPFEIFDKNFSAMQALVLGMEVGLAIGVLLTYLWLRGACGCSLRWKVPLTRRQRRRAGREGDMSLLWSTMVHPDVETPPPFRRQLSLPDRTAPYPAYAVSDIAAERAGLQIDAIRLPDRSETPPPPYNECRLNI